MILVVASDHFFKHTLPFSICSFFFFFPQSTENYSSTLLWRRDKAPLQYGILLGFRSSARWLLIPLLLLGCNHLSSARGFQVIVALGCGCMPEQGGVAAELDERRDQYGGTILSVTLAPEAQFGPKATPQGPEHGDLAVLFLKIPRSLYRA